MREILLFTVAAALVNNVVLSQFLGLCPFLGVSRDIKTAAGMGTAVTFVMTLASLIAALVYKYVLVPADVAYLQTIVFILVIAALVQFIEMLLKKNMVSLYQALGIYLPLITTNCAVLGIAIINVSKEYNVGTSTLNGFATGAGFLIAIVIMAGLREKLDENTKIPKALQGTPVVFMTAMLMSLAFYGFSSVK